MVKDHQAWRKFYRTVTVIVKAFVPVSPPLVVPTVTADVVAAVGVLEFNPVAVLIEAQQGSAMKTFKVPHPLTIVAPAAGREENIVAVIPVLTL